MKTVKIEDLDFTAKFELEATRQDCKFQVALCPIIVLHGLTCNVDTDVHAFLGWFDTHFNACHKRISFSTGPHAKVSIGYL